MTLLVHVDRILVGLFPSLLRLQLSEGISVTYGGRMRGVSALRDGVMSGVGRRRGRGRASVSGAGHRFGRPRTALVEIECAFLFHFPLLFPLQSLVLLLLQPLTLFDFLALLVGALSFDRLGAKLVKR